MSSPASENRRPYRGSCHCGRIRYIAFISLPAAVPKDTAASNNNNNDTATCFYKCNCAICLKANLIHTRLSNAPQDFYLLSPTNLDDLSNYKCESGRISWYFCPTCGVRCFYFNGKGKVDDDEEVEIEIEPGKVEKIKGAWRPDEKYWPKEGGETMDSCLSVNAVTLEPEGGLDLRELVEKKCLRYDDMRENPGESRVEGPYSGGTW